MSASKRLARLSELYINTGDPYTIVGLDTITPPTSPDAAVWTKVSNIKSLDPSIGRRSVDTEDFDNAGWEDHEVTGRSLSLRGTYNKVADVDATPNTFNAGQAALEALALEMGTAAVGQFKLVVLGTDVCYVFEASVEMGDAGGGGLNDLGEIGFTLQGKGVPYKGEEPPLTSA